ncbi:hypothetical protein A3K64_02565 [Candidatus Micrarchaeota archaeon RBG_16_36_9]|nr:MAG: hypothetical protein A3K64_02565 [Candidatus Micrarchaeota archaeon RBG_16_36_9]
MKKLIYLLIFAVVLTSLCSELPIQLPFPLPDLNTNAQGISNIDSGSPDIFLNVESLSPEVKSERSIQFFFSIRNKQTYDLSDVKFEIYDRPCFDKSNSEENFIRDCGILKPNASCTWSSRWTADKTESDKTCSIRFLLNYSARNLIYQDIVVLPESEYNQREASGTLNSIPIQLTSAKGPLQVYLSFSEPQPFIADKTGYSMHVNYNNVGDGFFDNLEDKIIVSVPDNMDLSCEDYTGSQTLTLNKDLKFIKGRAVSSVCNFNTPQLSTMSIRSLNMEINYKYTLYDSFTITVRGP